MPLSDSIYALVLVGVLVYIWRVEPPRLLLSPLMLLSFFVLYGAGHFIYYAGADTVEDVHQAVSTSMVLMWLCLLGGMELAKAAFPLAAGRAAVVTRDWSKLGLVDEPVADGALIFAGLVIAFAILGVFIALGKPSQMASFLALDSTLDKQKYRLEYAGQGGYVYQTLIASIAPFVGFLLLMKGRIPGNRALWAVGVLVVMAVFAGKLGTFHKVPWLVFTLQLVVLAQATRRLDLSIGRFLVIALLLVLGTGLVATLALPELNTLQLSQWLAYRFFEVNNEVIYQTFYVYPDHIPHTYGMNIGLLQRLFGSGELVSAHTQVASFFGADGATFDAFFIGDAWVDFGYPGVAVMALGVGFAIKSLDLSILSLGKTPLTLALLGSSLYGLFQIQVTSAFTAFLSGGLIFIPLVVLLSTALISDINRSIHAQQALAGGSR